MKTFLLIILLFCGQLYAQEISKASKNGLALILGSGISYGGNGVLAEYQISLKEKIRISPFIGMGISIGGDDSSTTEFYWYNVSTGFNFEYGNIHRLIAGTQFFLGNNVLTKPDTASINKKTIYGPAFQIGYKGTASFGLLWQITVGVTYIQNPLETDKKFSTEPIIGAGLGYKF